MSAWAIIVAGGSGARMGLGHNKALAMLAGQTVLGRSVRAFDGLVEGCVIVTRAEDIPAVQALGLDAIVTTGGESRQASVLAGLEALPQGATVALVHDAARPFVDAGTIRRCIEAVRAYGSGVASVPVKDTIKQVDQSGIVTATPARDTLRAAQTPQAFPVAALRDALRALADQGIAVTDDADAMERMGHPVHMVMGDYRNIKLTTPEDLAMAETMLGGGMPRVGQGYDVHRLVEGRPLVLCGVEIPYEKGLLGHSDADVALHALMDALLGAAALGDIGTHFPDTDARYKGISSLALLEDVRALLAEHGFATANVDVTIIAQRPKLAPYRAEMRQNIAQALGLPLEQINVKATTTEGLGFAGEGLGIAAQAVAMIKPIPST